MNPLLNDVDVPEQDRAAVEVALLNYAFLHGCWPTNLQVVVGVKPDGAGWFAAPDDNPTEIPTNLSATVAAEIRRWYRWEPKRS